MRRTRDRNSSTIRRDASIIWVEEDGDGALALSNNWLVVATDEDALFDTLDMISGNGGDSLADNPNFQEAQAALPDRRFALVYADYEGIGDEFGQTLGMGRMPPGADTFGIETPRVGGNVLPVG